jgi:uncharacterized protein YdeI (YjbR/CyaY-like superfamily)
MSENILNGNVHKLTAEITTLLENNVDLCTKWNLLTENARDQWICWITIAKKEETKQQHLIRFQEELLQGKKRPCCWPGCPHRNPKTAKWFK